MLDEYFRQYALIAIFVAVAAAVPVGMLVASWALTVLKIRPYAPDPIKKAIYECGFETLSGRWSQFNFRFYSFALIFVVFDVEVVFLFPWAASFGLLSAQFGMFVLSGDAGVRCDPGCRVALRLAQGIAGMELRHDAGYNLRPSPAPVHLGT